MFVKENQGRTKNSLVTNQVVVKIDFSLLAIYFSKNTNVSKYFLRESVIAKVSNHHRLVRIEGFMLIIK